ncbi:MAG: cysteine desulfurase [Alphaproteobacteria bacterium]|nr:cysteine desulfurase [Alphaproteobacteria bacterium]
MSPRPFDVARIRAEFPILARSVNGHPLTYLDNAASAQKPRAVIEAMREVMEEEYANVHRGVHYLSARATLRFEAARETARRFLNAEKEEEVLFTHGGTEAFNLIASSFLEPTIEPGDEIVLSEMEHHSNIVPWHFLRERKGAVLRWAALKPDGSLDLDHFASLLNRRTRLVATSHMSNVLGTVTPANEIVHIAHAHGVPVLFDGCQAAVHRRIDVRALDCDFYVATGHKLFGPTGIGLLYAKARHLKVMRPYQGGGEMIRTVGFDKITYAAAPHRFEAGTPPIIEAIGLGAALEWWMGEDRDAGFAHEHDLLTYTAERLKELNWIRIFGEAEGKGAIIAFEVEGVHAHDVATIIDSRGVAVRAGHHCAQPLMQRLGTPATARASFAIYNTREDADRLIAALHHVREVFA